MIMLGTGSALIFKPPQQNTMTVAQKWYDGDCNLSAFKSTYRIIPYKRPLPNKRPHHFMTLANGIDPDETAPMGAVSSGSTLFA